MLAVPIFFMLVIGDFSHQLEYILPTYYIYVIAVEKCS